MRSCNCEEEKAHSVNFFYIRSFFAILHGKLLERQKNGLGISPTLHTLNAHQIVHEGQNMSGFHQCHRYTGLLLHLGLPKRIFLCLHPPNYMPNTQHLWGNRINEDLWK